MINGKKNLKTLKKEWRKKMKINVDNLKKMIDEKYISVQKHPDLDLFIYNYTQKAQFDRVWNNETLQCRGLILDGDFNVVARPFPKFFNLEEAIDKGEQLPIEDFEVTEKEDGSLGILYYADDFYLATRGSFVSEQAIKGTEILMKKYGDIDWNPDFTYLFEIIFPSNRIVLDYKGMEDLILLAVIDTKQGTEMPYNELKKKFGGIIPLVKKLDGIKDFNKLKELQEDNREGFVIRFKSGKRYKVKFEEYVRLHRLITGVNARRIWDLLRNKQPLDELLERVPDEFFDWVKSTKENLEAQYTGYEDSARWTWNLVKELPTRKEQAQAIFKQNKDCSAIVFKILDGQPHEEIIWQMIKPKHETPFKIE